MGVTQIAGSKAARLAFPRSEETEEVSCLEREQRLRSAYVGVDVHKQEHVAVVVDCFGQHLGMAVVANRREQYPQWVSRLQDLAPDLTLVFGLENTSTWGRGLADYLQGAGYRVHDVAPVRTDRGRRRQPHPDKTDEQDALAIAKVLLQELSNLPETRHDDRVWTLQLAVSQREGLVREQTRVKNRLHALLAYPYPAYASYFSEPFGKTALAFWQRYPSPGHLNGVTTRELSEFLREQSHYALGWSKAEQIQASLTAHPAERECQAERDELLRLQLAQLERIQAQIGQVEVQAGRLVALLGEPLRSIPGVDVVMAAELLAGIGDVRRFATADKLARYAGIAPKEWRSAGKGTRTRSEHGQRGLHATFFRLAVIQVQVSRKGEPLCPQSRAYYEKKLGEGKSKKAALTSLMRVLVRVIWRVLKEQQPYYSVAPAGAGQEQGSRGRGRIPA